MASCASAIHGPLRPPPRVCDLVSSRARLAEMSSDTDSPPQFHRGLTLFLVLGMSLLLCTRSVGSAVPVHRILALEHPAATARAYFEHAIELDAALASEPEWKRRVLALALGTSRPALVEAADAYAEVVDAQARVFDPPAPKTAAGAALPAGSGKTTAGASTTPAPVEDASGCALKELVIPPKDDRATLTEFVARLAILQGEAERPDDARTSARKLENLGQPALASAIQYAYEPLVPEQRRAFESFDLAQLQPGWARERLELRLAHRCGATERERVLNEAAAERQQHLRTRANVLLAVWLVPALIGLAALLVWLLRDRPELARGNAAVPAEWTFEDGFAVLTRSLVFGILIVFGLGFGLKALDVPLANVWPVLALPLPLLWLVHRGLLAPRVLSFLRTFGLDSLPGGPWRWIALVCALFTATELGGSLLLELLGRAGFTTHWAESVDAEMLSAESWAFAGYVLVLVAWVPLFQELFCRGLLFATLRTRMPFVPAALWSAALLGAFLNLSAERFAVWMWTGFVLAYALEHTRSLLALVAYSTLVSAIYCLGYQLFYR